MSKTKTAPAPTAPEPPAAPDLLRSFHVEPRVTTLDGRAGTSTVIAVELHGREATAAVQKFVIEAREECRALLMKTREQFFRTGPGADLRAREQALADLEQQVRDSRAAEDKLRAAWRFELSTGSTADIESLEQKMTAEATNRARLEARLSASREALVTLRKQAANDLFDLLGATRQRFAKAAEEKRATILKQLTAAVNGLWCEWLKAGGELAGANRVSSDALERMAAVTDTVPKMGRPEPEELGLRPDPVKHEPRADDAERAKQIRDRHTPWMAELSPPMAPAQPGDPLYTMDGRPVLTTARIINKHGLPELVDVPVLAPQPTAPTE